MRPATLHRRHRSRREFLMRSCSGLGALAALLHAAGRRTAPIRSRPRSRDHPPTAKSVIWLFMEGGPSHVDLFDPKPELQRAGRPADAAPRSAKSITAMGTASNTLMPSTRTWKQYGAERHVGLRLVSRTSPQHVDDMTVFRSCWADGLNHVGSVCQMNTGSILAGRPSMGAWVTYGLGSGQPQPADLRDPDRRRRSARRPQELELRLPARELTRARCSAARARRFCDLTPPPDDRRRAAARPARPAEVAEPPLRRRQARTTPNWKRACNSYELAYRMQSAAPEAVDLTKEIAKPPASSTAWTTRSPRSSAPTACWPAAWWSAACASSSSTPAAAAAGTRTPISTGNHGRRCQATDKPIAGLLTDLKARGLLDSTLVVWGGEFGRTPFNEKGNGRDHNPVGLHHVDGRRRHQEGPGHRHAPTRSACAPSSGPCTCTICTRPSSGAWAWIT